jgi:hypothetical protein
VTHVFLPLIQNALRLHPLNELLFFKGMIHFDDDSLINVKAEIYEVEGEGNFSEQKVYYHYE